MRPFPALVLVLGLASCSTTLPDETCPTVINRGLAVEFCQEKDPGTYAIFTDELWRLIDGMDDVLGSLDLDPIGPRLRFADVTPTVTLLDRPEGAGMAGYFAGWHDRDTWKIVLLVDEDVPRPTADDRTIPTRHEYFHAWERNNPATERTDATYGPNHFVNQALAEAVLGAAASPEGCAFFDAYWNGGSDG